MKSRINDFKTGESTWWPADLVGVRMNQYRVPVDSEPNGVDFFTAGPEIMVGDTPSKPDFADELVWTAEEMLAGQFSAGEDVVNQDSGQESDSTYASRKSEAKAKEVAKALAQLSGEGRSSQEASQPQEEDEKDEEEESPWERKYRLANPRMKRLMETQAKKQRDFEKKNPPYEPSDGDGDDEDDDENLVSDAEDYEDEASKPHTSGKRVSKKTSKRQAEETDSDGQVKKTKKKARFATGSPERPRRAPKAKPNQSPKIKALSKAKPSQEEPESEEDLMYQYEELKTRFEKMQAYKPIFPVQADAKLFKHADKATKAEIRRAFHDRLRPQLVKNYFGHLFNNLPPGVQKMCMAWCQQAFPAWDVSSLCYGVINESLRQRRKYILADKKRLCSARVYRHYLRDLERGKLCEVEVQASVLEVGDLMDTLELEHEELTSQGWSTRFRTLEDVKLQIEEAFENKDPDLAEYSSPEDYTKYVGPYTMTVSEKKWEIKCSHFRDPEEELFFDQHWTDSAAFCDGRERPAFFNWVYDPFPAKMIEPEPALPEVEIDAYNLLTPAGGGSLENFVDLVPHGLGEAKYVRVFIQLGTGFVKIGTGTVEFMDKCGEKRNEEHFCAITINVNGNTHVDPKNKGAKKYIEDEFEIPHVISRLPLNRTLGHCMSGQHTNKLRALDSKTVLWPRYLLSLSKTLAA
eukprot:tig00020553_g10500.t1